MDGPRPRSWAPVGLPSYLLSGLLGRMGGSRPRSWAPIGSFYICFLGSWVGWVARGQEAGLSLGSLHICFLGSWVGWVGRCQEAGLPLGSLHIFFLSGLLGRMALEVFERVICAAAAKKGSMFCITVCERCPQIRHLGHGNLFSKKRMLPCRAVVITIHSFST